MRLGLGPVGSALALISLAADKLVDLAAARTAKLLLAVTILDEVARLQTIVAQGPGQDVVGQSKQL